MNRHGAVLAADSATTVSGWNGTSRETRYFKGANKIHQLSNDRPVGLMIFDSADILSVPWEVVVKAYRAEFGHGSSDTLEGYARAFCHFIENDKRLFPEDVQQAETIRAGRSLAYSFALDIINDATIDRTAWTATFDNRISDERTRIDTVSLGYGMTQVEADVAVARLKPDMETALTTYITAPDEPVPTDYGELAELVLWMLLKCPENHLSTTGIVIAGYGEHDVFPGHLHYISCGLLMGKHLVREAGRAAVTHSIPADLSAFAQRSMIDTFQLGVDLGVYGDAITSLRDALQDFGAKIVAESGGNMSAVPDVAKLHEDAKDKFVDSWLAEARSKHALPLRRVLASLPIPEMAELAETLVNLQSLKEKVTKPSEEVGGPIDVAVITRSEGFIWIKRKLYFDSAMNPRYSARLSALYN